METGRKDDAGKPDLSLIPPEAIEELGKVLTFGAKKYSPDNWKNVNNANQRYYAALLRHLNSWWSGEKNDIESGLSHLSHAITNLSFLIWFEKQEEKNE